MQKHEKENQKNNKKKKWIILVLLLLVAFIILLLLFREKWETEQVGILEFNHYEKPIEISGQKRCKYKCTYKFNVTTKADEEKTYIAAILQQQEDGAFYNNENIRISLQKNGKYVIGSKKEGVLLSSLDGFESGEKTGYSNISYETIKKGNIDKYKLTIYLDSSAEKNKGYKYGFKVKVYEAGEDIKPTTIKLDLGDGKGEQEISINANGKYENLPIPERDGYIFKGWFTDDGKQITSKDYFNAITSSNLHAEYEAKTYKITINANGGEYKGNKNFTKQYTDEIIVETPTRTGYTFMGWKIDGKANVKKNTLSKVASDVTLEAQWKVNKYKLTVKTDTGLFSDKKYTLNYGETKTIEVPTKTGYTFKGWTFEGKGSISGNTIKIGEGDATLIANWQINTYTVNFDSNGGKEQISKKQIQYKDKIGSLITPTKTGYTFIGWYNGNKKITEDTRIENNMNLVAKYKINTYELKVNPNGGSWNGKETEQKFKLDYNTTKEIENPTKTGYTFVDWTIDSEDAKLKDKIFTIGAGDAKLIANWQINTYRVEFNVNGGNEIYEAINRDYNTELGELPIPTKKGYTFDGWYNGNEKVESTTLVKDNTILEAHYTINEYELVVNPDGGIYNDNEKETRYTLKYQEKIEIAEPTRDGYIFMGWTIDSEDAVIDGNKLIIGAENATLTATWLKNDFSYIVKHYQQSLDGNTYTLVDIDTYTGLKKGTVVKAEPKNYDGFIIPETKELTIDTDNEQNIIEYKYDRKSYVLTINPNTGLYDDKSENTIINDVKFGATVDLKTPSKLGYTFDGWEISGENTDIIGNTMLTMGKENTVITAKWIANKYNVNFNGNGGQVKGNNIVEATYDEKYGELPTGEKTGYTFLGWFTEPEGGEEVKETDTVKITQNIILYAHWEINKQTLTINPNGGKYDGEESNTIERIEFDGTYTVRVPTREGYTFKYWNLTGNGMMSTLTSESTFTMKTEDCTLQAEWEANTYKLKLNPNEGELENTEKYVKYDEQYGTFAIPTRTGYTFDGWYTEVSGGQKLESSEIVKITEDTEIFAHWTIITSKLMINPNGGEWENSNEIQEFEMNYAETKEIQIPKREGYTFTSWTLNGKLANMTDITANATFTMGIEDASLTANWEINSYVITIDANGGAVSDTRIIKKYNETLETMLEPVKNGYTFLGWYENVQDENTKVELNTKVSKDMLLTAKWEANPVDLTINYNDGITDSEVIHTSFEMVNKINIPRREGYTFKGWELTEGNSQINISLTEQTVVIMGTENTTITAKWEANKYNLILEANGGVLENNTKELTYDQAYGELETPIKTGYTFKGWYTSQDYSEEITNKTIVKLALNHTIFAKWEANNYKLSINYNGGEGEETVRDVTYNKSIGTLPITTKKGNTFLGWYIDEKIISDEYIYKFDANKELTAKWEVNKYDLTIDPNGGTYAGNTAPKTSLEEFNSTVTIEEPTRFGYSFNGWEIVGEATISNDTLTMGAENTTIKAKWKVVTGKLTIDYNDEGTTPNKVYNDLAYLDEREIEDPTRTGYEFTGWIVEGENARLNDKTFTMGTKDSKLTATWVANTYTYIVKHYKQTVDGTGYTLVDADTEENEELFDTEITPETKQYEGFTAPEKITKTITTSDNLIEYKYARNKHKLTINPNGGEYKGSSNIVEEELYYDELTSVANPIKTGYTFTNWTITGGELIDNGVRMHDEDITLKANYTPNVYMLIYNANGGGIPFGGKVVTYGQTIGELPSPSKAGYTFKGWYLNIDDESTKVEETDIVSFTQHTILNAKWEKCDYRLVIDANGGLWNNQSYCAIGSSVGTEIDVQIPTRKGYTFTGWTLDGEGTMSSLILDSKFTGGEGNATLTANWVQNKYTLYYNTNGGNVSPLTETLTYDEKYGTLAIPTKNGYTFDGWYTELEGGTLVTGEEVLTEENNIYIFAHWTKNSYKLTVNPNGGNWEENGNVYSNEQEYVLEYGATKEIKAPTRIGYRFNTWKFEGALNGSSLTPMVTDGTFTMGYSNALIKADWIPNEYTIIFDANGGVSTQGNKQVTYDEEYGELPTASREGYTFEGWYTEKEGGEQVQSTDIVKTTKTQTLYAQYKANEYTITYVPNNGTITENTKTVTYNSEYGNLQLPNKAGYTFNGWYLEEELITKVTENSIVTTIGDHKLYAGYKANKYQVTFDVNEGEEITPSTKTVTYDQEYSILPTPTRTGYEFKGWYTEKENGTEITADMKVTITNDHTLYAIWTPAKYTVIFNTNGGNPVDDIKVTYLSNYENLPIPTRTGYEFMGWYLDSDFNNKIEDTTQVLTTKDHILYAKWLVSKYRVIFDTDGGTTCKSKEVTFGKEYGELEFPTKDGYIFTGWYADTSYSVQVQENTKVSIGQDHTLYAGWISESETPDWTQLPTTAGSSITGKYVVNSDTTIKSSTSGQSALNISGTTYIYIPKGVTLTLRGGSGSGRTGGGAGIKVPTGTVLIVLGEGTLNATGGNAGGGQSGSSGSKGTLNVSSEYWKGGTSGAGGNGGGGAGAGIGTTGGTGGYGGSSVGGPSGYIHKDNTEDGSRGNSGSSGSSSSSMGTVYALGKVTINATGGKPSTVGSGGGASGSSANDKGSGWKLSYTAGNGGGGGGGGAGYSGNGIGSGGPGAGGGGAGGSGGVRGRDKDYIYWHGAGGYGGAGSSYGGTGSKSSASSYGSVSTGGLGGNGGGSGSYGNNGTLYKSSTATVNGRNNYTTSDTNSNLQYTITLNSQMADTIGTKNTTVLYGGVLPSITIPTKEGYTFDGYYLGVNGKGKKYYDATGKAIEKFYRLNNITLYANWIPNE